MRLSPHLSGVLDRPAPAMGKVCPKPRGETPQTVGLACLVVSCGRRTASHADRRQKLLGKSPSVAIASREASQLGNTESNKAKGDLR